MIRRILLLFISTTLIAQNTSYPSASNTSNAPVYTSDGKLVFPPNYREWIYLTTGIDMDYNPDLKMQMGHSMFDNIFVNPEAYKAFVATGTWPDKTMLILEGRMAGTRGSINKAGKYQTTDIMAHSIHIKDQAHGGWVFYGYDDDLKPAQQIPATAVCYSCHEQHGAVDTTFVQFYPTLLPIAKTKQTFSPGYLKDEAASASEAGVKKSH